MTTTLFLPGLVCDAFIWETAASSLPGEGIIADLTTEDSIAAMADRALSGAPERFNLVALSMGGYVAFEMLRQAPERVSALALFDTSASLDSPERVAQRRAGLSSMAAGRFAGVTNRLLPQLIHRDLIDGPVGQSLKDMAARVGGAVFARQQKAILERRDPGPVLAGLTVPTLIAVGDGDVLTPPTEALDLHLRIRSSTFHVIRDCGHLPPLEQPAVTRDLLRDFLW